MSRRLLRALQTSTLLLSLLFLALTRGALAQAASAVAPPRFHIRQVRLEGNTVLQSQMQALLATVKDADVTLADLEQLAARITAAYRTAGYFLATAFVPTQEIKSGEARLVVVEGRIHRVFVEGNRHYATGLFQRLMRPVLSEIPLRRATYLRALLLMNELMEVSVTSVFKSSEVPGTIDVTLKVTDHAPHFVELEYNDFGIPSIGEHRAGLGLIYGNLTGNGDVAYLRSTWAFPSALRRPLLTGTYATPVNDDGTRVLLTYANSNSVVGGDFRVLDVRGTADIYTVTLSQPLQRTLTQRQDATLSTVSNTSDNSVLGNSRGHDEIRKVVLTWSGTYEAPQRRDIVSVAVHQGLGGAFGGSALGDANVSRPGASDDFTHVNVDVADIHQLGSTFLVLRGNGQWSDHALLVPEQYSLGGADSVRGYVQSAALGDNGWLLGAEWRVPLGPHSPLQADAFVDYGGVSITKPSVGEKSHVELMGAGFGLRSSLGPSTDARVDLGLPVAPPGGVPHHTVVIYGQITSRIRF